MIVSPSLVVTVVASTKTCPRSFSGNCARSDATSRNACSPRNVWDRALPHLGNAEPLRLEGGEHRHEIDLPLRDACDIGKDLWGDIEPVVTIPEIERDHGILRVVADDLPADEEGVGSGSAEVDTKPLPCVGQVIAPIAERIICALAGADHVITEIPPQGVGAVAAEKEVTAEAAIHDGIVAIDPDDVSAEAKIDRDIVGAHPNCVTAEACERGAAVLAGGDPVVSERPIGPIVQSEIIVVRHS